MTYRFQINGYPTGRGYGMPWDQIEEDWKVDQLNQTVFGAGQRFRTF